MIDLLINANHKRTRLSRRTQQYLSWSLVKAVAYLHDTCNLAHLDLKPDNIALTDLLSLSLIDFGWTCIKNQPINNVTGTDMYMPPEVRRCGS